MNGRCENKNPIEDAIADIIYARKTLESKHPCPGVLVLKTDNSAGKEQYVALVIKRPVESKKEVGEWLDSVKDLGDWKVMPGYRDEEIFMTVDYSNFPFPVKPIIEFNPSSYVVVDQLKKSLELED